MLLRIPLILLAKLLRRALRATGGHGSALPGRILEKLDGNFLPRLLRQLPQGVVVVTGTNGKTTSAHMLVHLLRAEGKKVLTNSSGSNLTRGLISTIVEHAAWNGKLHFDIAVFELDEAYAPLFTKKMPPRIVVALNVMRDQLDRYGELDMTASFIGRAAKDAKIVVVNGNDELLLNKTHSHSERLTFGFSRHLESVVSSEANLYTPETSKQSASGKKLDVEIVAISATDRKTTFILDSSGTETKVVLTLLGTHNALNASAVLLTTQILLPQATVATLAAHLNNFIPAFGRGETLTIDDRELTVALIKNPSGFTQNLKTFIRPGIDAVFIVINDEYADGRDVSWLWDVQLSRLENFKGIIFVGGKRRFDMALRLKYQGIPFKVIDENQIELGMKQVLGSDDWHKHLLIIPTYTAMLAVRRWLNSKRGRKHTW